MEVILNQDVDKLGKAGSVIKVKDGFARNFLIPNGLALPLTSGNLKRLEQEKQRKKAQLEKVKQELLELKSKLEGVSLTIPALVQDEDKLYGSIAGQDVAQALEEEGFTIDKNAVVLDEAIKTLGIYEIPVRLHPEVSATIKVWIVKK
ncbi:MAG: 50S ribosomal protein L9 [Omnitrophica WOR_2 bacterium SM23_72]|nr:MAG: 50S ribosomal protein L9 [Omnitrophica WOR_2 bacterium SM23_72]